MMRRMSSKRLQTPSKVSEEQHHQDQSCPTPVSVDAAPAEFQVSPAGSFSLAKEKANGDEKGRAFSLESSHLVQEEKDRLDSTTTSKVAVKRMSGLLKNSLKPDHSLSEAVASGNEGPFSQSDISDKPSLNRMSSTLYRLQAEKKAKAPLTSISEDSSAGSSDTVLRIEIDSMPAVDVRRFVDEWCSSESKRLDALLIESIHERSLLNPTPLFIRTLIDAAFVHSDITCAKISTIDSFVGLCESV